MAVEWAEAHPAALGMSYREMEQASGISHATLQRAIDGDPALKAARAKAKAR